MIAFFNTCVDVPPKSARLATSELMIAEGEYSKSRLRALADEWSADYPALIDFSRILQHRPPSFKLMTVSDSELEELCLHVAVERLGQRGLLVAEAIHVVDGVTLASTFRVTLFSAFYKVGLIGLKLERHEAASWADDVVRSVSTAEIDGSTSAVVHPSYHRALGSRNTLRKHHGSARAGSIWAPHSDGAGYKGHLMAPSCTRGASWTVLDGEGRNKLLY